MKIFTLIILALSLAGQVSAASDSFSIDDAGNLLIRVFGGLSLGLINSGDLWLMVALAALVFLFFLFVLVAAAAYIIKAYKGGG
jgi:hypothetical protein